MDRRRKKQGTEPLKKQKTQDVASADDFMTDKRKGIIAKNYAKLAANLTAGSMLNNLVSESVITMEQLDELNAERVEHKRAGLLLGMLVKGKNSTFGVLIEAFNNYNMPHLAKLLKTADEAEDKEEKEIDDEDVKEEVMDEDAVVVAYNGEEYEVDVEEDGTLLASTINSQLESGITAKGLKYTNQATGRSRAVRLQEGKFFPPKQGWGEGVYNIVPGKAEQNKSTVEQSSAGNSTEENGVKDESKGSTPATGQSSAVNSTAETGEFTPMTEEHVGILTDNRMVLINTMDPFVMGYLRSMRVIDQREEGEIKHGKAKCAQIEALLDRLQDKDDSAFGKLVIALRKVNQGFLAKLLS